MKLPKSLGAKRYAVKDKLDNYYNMLFKPDEYICCAWNEKNTKIFPVSRGLKHPYPQWISLNALDPLIDRNPTEEYHAKDKPRRADHNVTSLKNILVEFDSGGIKGQLKFIDDIAMPFTTSVFSGRKSAHFIISMENDFQTLEEYSNVVKTIYYEITKRATQLESKLAVDFKCKNPSRLTRAPGFKREGVIQELLDVRSVVTQGELEEFLGISFKAIMEAASQANEDTSNNTNFGVSVYTREYLTLGAEPGTRNDSLYKAACDLFRNNYSFDDICNVTRGVADLTEGELTRTIRSAQYRNGE